MSPERGVLQLATCAVLNAIWDLWAKVEGKPLWKLVVDMTPEQYVSCIDFRYITDAITRDEAIALLRSREEGVEEREKIALAHRAVPGYSTSVGGLGTTNEEVQQLLKLALNDGFTRFKVGSERSRSGVYVF